MFGREWDILLSLSLFLKLKHLTAFLLFSLAFFLFSSSAGDEVGVDGRTSYHGPIF